MNDLEFLGGESFRGQVAVETDKGIAERVAELGLGRAVSMNDGGAAVVSGAAERLRDDTEHGNGVVAVNIDLRDGSFGIGKAIGQGDADRRPAPLVSQRQEPME